MIKKGKKRVLITLLNEKVELFERISKIKGQSKSELVSSWIDKFDLIQLENEQLKKQLKNYQIKEASFIEEVKLLRKGIIR